MNIENLTIMYNWLLDNQNKVKKSFSMNCFRKGIDDWKNHECNSVGCMLGWGVGAFPFKDIPLNTDDTINIIDFLLFSDEILGVAFESEVGRFLFAGEWTNTHYDSFNHAMKRLKWIIDGKEMEKNKQYNTFIREVKYYF